jgi:hypothetical protein
VPRAGATRTLRGLGADLWVRRTVRDTGKGRSRTPGTAATQAGGVASLPSQWIPLLGWPSLAETSWLLPSRNPFTLNHNRFDAVSGHTLGGDKVAFTGTDLSSRQRFRTGLDHSGCRVRVCAWPGRIAQPTRFNAVGGPHPPRVRWPVPRPPPPDDGFRASFGAVTRQRGVRRGRRPQTRVGACAPQLNGIFPAQDFWATSQDPAPNRVPIPI